MFGTNGCKFLNKTDITFSNMSTEYWSECSKHITNILYDNLKEWTRTDSLGYTLDYEQFSQDELGFSDVVKTQISLYSHRFSGFIQNTWERDSEKMFWQFIAGLRANYWTYNEDLNFSPRFQLYMSPKKFNNLASDTTKATKNLTFKLAAGSGVTLTPDTSDKRITIAATANQVFDFGTFTAPVGFTLDMGAI